jgi:hypothetical protein
VRFLRRIVHCFDDRIGGLLLKIGRPTRSAGVGRDCYGVSLVGAPTGIGGLLLNIGRMTKRDSEGGTKNLFPN